VFIDAGSKCLSLLFSFQESYKLCPYGAFGKKESIFSTDILPLRGNQKIGKKKNHNYFMTRLAVFQLNLRLAIIRELAGTRRFVKKKTPNAPG